MIFVSKSQHRMLDGEKTIRDPGGSGVSLMLPPWNICASTTEPNGQVFHMQRH